jgi:hypothetical protein
MAGIAESAVDANVWSSFIAVFANPVELGSSS